MLEDKLHQQPLSWREWQLLFLPQRSKMNYEKILNFPSKGNQFNIIWIVNAETFEHGHMKAETNWTLTRIYRIC